MRIEVVGFYGWGNTGDEGILRAIMDSLGPGNAYVISTSLPFNLWDHYVKNHLDPRVLEVRSLQDVRTDYDALILGGGKLPFGYGWMQVLNALSREKPVMNYGVGYRFDQVYSERLKPLYRDFLSHFQAITVRDPESFSFLESIGVQSSFYLSMCPAINLEELLVPSCPEGKIVVCPRYEDNPVNNLPQTEWIVDHLKDDRPSDIILVPFAPRNMEEVDVDLALCKEISRRLGGVEIFYTDGFSPRKVKYLISKSSHVISARYHGLLWASAHGIPFEAPTPTLNVHPKLRGFLEMHSRYGSEGLKRGETRNRLAFERMMKVDRMVVKEDG